MDFIPLDGKEVLGECRTPEELSDAITQSLYDGDCPDCGSAIVDGKCSNPSKHNGGVE